MNVMIHSGMAVFSAIGLKYTHTRKELLLICRVVSRFTSVRVGILQHREKSHNFL
ncbi:Uncharacterised protein [Escherichia coli]|uniref:Uncharacterized protein n=1 Tax=Escherichia coli TaxID=562 RepID=A0A377K870_ECOLX|nr:Uncharacterised protein [Escherichia coli]